MPSSKNQKINQNATTSKESTQAIVEPNEIDERPPPQNIYEKIYDIADKLAATNLGQGVIEKTDRILTVVEKTAKWSLPQKEPNADDKGIPAPVLERPCSWIPFLSLIIALRVIRVGLSFGSIIIGNRPVSPSNMVHFIQSRRRRLRAIKYRGLRSIRMKKQCQLSDKKSHGVIGKLTSIFKMVICRPGITYEPETQVIVKTTTQKNKKLKTNEENHIMTFKGSLNSNETISNKRPLEKDDDNDSETDDDLPVNKLLDKYGDNANDLDDDPDFIPSDTKSESSLSTDSELSDDEELRQKLEELKRQHKELDRNVGNNEAVEEITIPRLENKEENEIKSEKLVNSDVNDATSSVTVNPTRMSPKIAQNGNADEEKYENFYDTLECGSDDTEQKKGSPPNIHDKKLANNIAVENQNMNVKKIIQNREFTPNQIDKPITTDNTNNENLNENHVQSNQLPPPHSNQHHHTNQTKQHHNNKKYYNSNNSNHNSTYKYTKGRKINN